MRARRAHVDNCTTGIAHVKLAFDDLHFVAGKALFGRLRVDDFGLGASHRDNASIADLAAHFGVERVIKHNFGLLHPQR